MSALVRWQPEQGEVLPMPGQRCTSLDLTTALGQRLAYRAHVTSDFQLQDLVGQTIHIVDFYAHHVVRVDEETGEERPGTRAVMILDDGSLVSTGSESSLKCLMFYAAVYCRVPPFYPPLAFIVRASKSRRGPGKYLWLDLPEPAPVDGEGA